MRLFEEYLGDGVYAWFDGYQIWLWAERDGQRHEIAIDLGTHYAFNRYSAGLADRIKKWKAQEAAQ